MTLYEKFVLLSLLAAVVWIFTVVGTPASGESLVVIIPVTPGEWNVNQGYVTTSPEGERLACELGDYGEAIQLGVTSPDVYLKCVDFVYPKAYIGQEDGTLVPLAI